MADYRGTRQSFAQLCERALKEPYSVLGVVGEELMITENPTGRTYAVDPQDRWNTEKWRLVAREEPRQSARSLRQV